MNKWQVRLSALLLICWIVFLAILVTVDKPPSLGDWAEPAHFSSSLFLAFAVAGALLASGLASSPMHAGWYTLIAVTLLVVLLECIQPVVSSRNFQFQDMIDGVAGGACGGMLCAILTHWLGRSRFAYFAWLLSVLVLLVVGGLSLRPLPAPVACRGQLPEIDWSLATISNFRSVGEHIYANDVVFCEFAPGVSIDNHELVLHGGALVSVPLTGLLDALAQSGQLTFALRFKSDTTKRPRWPGIVASLIRGEKSNRHLARVLWSGENLIASMRLNWYEGTATNIAKRVSTRYHDVAIVYDGEWQTTYFDNEAVGYERSVLDPADPDGRLSLELGWRNDDHWEPFRGRIETIVISSVALSAARIGELFTTEAQH